MCNAWNHPPGCTCGWGGVGHLGRREPGTYSRHTSESTYWWVPPITHTYESYVNPNAYCPVCGASVFFYQSSDGGRVFFDELGPPWPKHPCTDNSSIPKQNGFSTVASTPKAIKKYCWQTDGWSPFFIKSVSRIDKYSLKITGMLGEEEITLYIKSVLKHHGKVNIISSECIGHVRKVGNIKYEVSLITTSGDTATISGFTLLSEARKGPDANQAPRKHKPGGKRTKYTSKPKKQVRSKGTLKKVRNPSNHAVALAFAEARKKTNENT